MKNLRQTIALGLIILGTLSATAQTSNSPMYAELALNTETPLTTSEKIIREVDKIVKLSDDLIDANEKQGQRIKEKIASRQARISDLKDNLEAESALLENREMVIPFEKYEFDVAENSLHLDEFEAKRNGSIDSFVLQLETKNAGKAIIDIVSPGGELLETIVVSNFNGKLREQIDLNAEAGKIYFLHITVGDEATTKKLRFI